MKKITLLTLILFLGLTATIIADEVVTEKDDVTLEKVDEKIDKIYDTQQVMYKEQKNNPLENKKYGIELNIFRVLTVDDDFSLSGGFSLFDVDRNAEIAFPIYYKDPDNEFDTKIFTLDCHYRHFLGNTQNGFYLSAFTRFANFDGYKDVYDYDDKDDDDYEDYKSHSFSDIGIGVGIGYRRFSYRGLYWGQSISFGRYLFSNDNDEFQDSWDLSPFDGYHKQIWNIEFLKFGWAF